MLEDRPYMRERVGPRAWPLSVVLMVVLVAAFILQCVNDVYVGSAAEMGLALTGAAVGRGYLWQLLTFQFLHVNLWHLIGNLIGLWFFGRFVENVVGKSRYLVAYFGSGFAGGLLQSLLMLAFPGHFGGYVFGASAGVSGIFAIFARLEAHSVIRLNFLLPVRADVLLWITAAISLFFTLVPSGRGGSAAHAAHLGGILAGLAFVKWGGHHDYKPLFGWVWLKLFRRHATSGKILSPRFSRVWARKNARALGGSDEDNAPADFISREVDPILDKISAHGIQSLTEHERRVLDTARKKISKR